MRRIADDDAVLAVMTQETFDILLTLGINVQQVSKRIESLRLPSGRRKLKQLSFQSRSRATDTPDCYVVLEFSASAFDWAPACSGDCASMPGTSCLPVTGQGFGCACARLDETKGRRAGRTGSRHG
jgi:hypothetical protein